MCTEECSYIYTIAVSIAFLAEGIALFALLVLLRLTIATGTISGFIFYANIVYSNRSIFFPSGRSNAFTFIFAWINLGHDINVCFYEGMDKYARIWLKFAFPFYIWSLCCVTILLSRKCPCVAKLLGNNPAAVLATLFLLSYTKIFSTITSVLSFTQVEYPHNQSKIVWLYDANVSLLKHMPLIVFSLAIFFFLFPCTILFFTNQWLFDLSDYRLFFWMNSPRVKYFLDAYNAPFKSKHRYWTGLLLIARLNCSAVDFSSKCSR